MFRHFLCGLCLLSWLATFHSIAQEDNKIISIKVFPEKVTLNVGEQLKFNAKGLNKHDQEVSFSPDWSATGGTITDDGWYTAGTTAGFHTVMATDPKTGAQGSASVAIKFTDSRIVGSDSDKIIRLELSPTKVRLSPGERVRFFVIGFNAKGEEVRLPARMIWHVTGGSIAPDGTYQAGGAPGSYLVQVKEANGPMTSAEVTIMGSLGQVVNVKVTPSEVQLKPYATQRFFATGYDSSGNLVSFVPVWEATGGVINADGIYQAGKTAGTYFVKATNPQGTSSTASVKIQAVNIAVMEIVPKGAILTPGQAQKFEVRALDSKGLPIAAAPIWSATGGIVQSDGTYRAGSMPGNYILTVSIDNMTVEVPIVVRTETPVRLMLSPASVTLKPGETIRFQASAYNEQNHAIETTVRWTVNGGSMDNTGLFLAGNVPGKYMIEVTTTDGVLTAQSTVQIGSVVATKSIEWVTIKPTVARVTPGEKVKFEVKAVDATGVEVPCNFIWSVDGGKLDGNIYTAGPKEGKFLVSVTAPSGPKATATVIVTPGTAKTTKEKATQMKVSPAEVRLKPNEQAVFEISLLDKDGNRAEGQFQWEATGGVYEAPATYRAGSVPGDYVITITEITSELKQEVKVQIYELPNEKTEPIVIQAWQTGQGGMLIGQVFIKGRVDHERAYLLQLVLFQKDGSQKVSTQIRVQPGQFFQFEGEYVRETTNAVGVVLYDSKFNPLYTYQKAVN